MTASLPIALLCASVVSAYPASKPAERATAVCVSVAEAARRHGVPVELAVALAYTASRFNPEVVSSAGAVGPLQILPWFHCPSKRRRGCDLVEYGVRAIVRHRTRYGGSRGAPDWSRVLCHWSTGNKCIPIGESFARTVLRRAKEFRLLAGGR